MLSNELTDTTMDSNIATPVNIEKLIKDFKTHYCMLDFDKGFIIALIIQKEE